MRKGSLLPIAVMALAIAGFVFVVAWAVSPNLKWPWSTNPKNTNTPMVACTDEAKICPDGTAVGRTGPNCEFADCPTVQGNSNLNTNSTININATYDFSGAASDQGFAGEGVSAIGRVKDSQGNVISTTPLRVVDHYFYAKFLKSPIGKEGRFEVSIIGTDGSEKLANSIPIQLNITVTDGYAAQ